MRGRLLLIIAGLAAHALAVAQTEPSQQPAAEAMTARLKWAAREARAPVAYESPTGHILFRALVAGHETWALLDNGAQRTLVDLSLAQRLRLRLSERTGAIRTVGGTIPVRVIEDVPLTIPGQFEFHAPVLGGADLRQISSMLGREIGLILGGDLLHRVALQLDPTRRTFNIFPSGSLRVPPTAPFLPLVGGEAKVEVEIGGQRVVLTIDLGASDLIGVTPETWARIAPAGATLVPGTHRQADGAVQERQRGRLPELRIGPATIRDAPVSIRRMSPAMGEGALGVGFFGRVGFVLDVRQGKVWIRPVREEPSER